MERERSEREREILVRVWLGAWIFNGLDPLTDAGCCKWTASENTMINRGGHVKGDNLC